MESLQVPLSCTEVWFTLRALLHTGCPFPDSDTDLNARNSLWLATICSLISASISSNCSERERHTQAWRQQGHARDLSKMRGVTAQHRQHSKTMKSKSKLISGIFECKHTSPANIQSHTSPHVHQNYWGTHGFVQNPICMFISPLSSAADTYLGPAITTRLFAYISSHTHHWFVLSYKITLSLFN